MTIHLRPRTPRAKICAAWCIAVTHLAAIAAIALLLAESWRG